jgi:aspartyl-tRNA synthetase
MRTHYSSEITPEIEEKEVTLCGWVHEIRDLGNVKFLILRDREGFIQVMAKKGLCEDKILEKIAKISKESVIELKGKVKKSPQAPRGVEIIPSSLNVISPAKTPLPLDVTQKVSADLDTRLDNRFMDLRKPEIAAIFKLRAKVIEAGRKFLREEGFIEIYTPKIIASASEGGTDLFPISYFDKDAFLAQSPQLYKQMMMATGFDRVFEITPYFRAEEHDTRRHLNEVTAIDIEMAFIQSEDDVMDILEGMTVEMIKEASISKEAKFLGKEIAIPKKAKRITYDNALNLLEKEAGRKIPWGEDLDREAEKLLGSIMKEKFNMELYFITKYPLEAKPFYAMPDTDKKYSRSFDLGYRGVEISSGGQRVHQYDLLEKMLKAKGLKPESFEFYLNAFKYGMPPHGGFGFGIDRIMMQLLEVGIREVVLFPRDRHRLTP